VSYSRAAREARELLSRNLVQKKRMTRAFLYKTTSKGKKLAQQVRKVLAYLK